MSTIGTKLARLRKQRGYSQEEVAAHLKVSQPAYHKWEAESSRPTNENLAKICDFYNIDMEELLDENRSVFSHNTISNATILNPTNSTISNINMNSPELLQTLVNNQQEISKLIDMQGKLINELIKK
ncbi:helix-turn-helix domain-containing protein [Sphingobacterium sp. SRCM116780]|uniref:helix-turn-helix domain-containing protein n=1 Tax=Sphingobacterium sp. SRCM116780 TaxID=2907623 RepID=UPI001F1D9CAE|nr:helix-turn-helix transcriptional regulator [Sphingobacterium sp. SRCM116780]UIR57823.1 helix-turn-helix domain-containing protein [Sphingobacterium sp. SRCM116780]